MRRSFVVWFSGALCTFALLAGAFSLWMERLGEAPPEQIIARQMRSSDTILFASGIDGDFFRYKIALFEQLSPRIVALGSSRAMQVRRDFFNADFANLGGAATSILSLEMAVDDLLRARQRLELAVLFADISWFNSASTPVSPPNAQPWRRLDPGHIYEAGSVLLSNSEKLGMLIPPPPDRLGLLGIMGNQGFDRYGSFYYVSIATGERSSADYRFAETARRIRYGVDRFEHAPRADAGAVDRFVNAVQELEASGVHVVLIFPPFAARVNDLMADNGGYEYVADLFVGLSQRGLRPLDYHDLRPLQRGVGNPDCEFVDGFHGGDVAYARLIRDAADRDARLRAVVDLPALDAFIAANAGATHGVRKFFRAAPEVDFLGLGCERAAPSSARVELQAQGLEP